MKSHTPKKNLRQNITENAIIKTKLFLTPKT